MIYISATSTQYFGLGVDFLSEHLNNFNKHLLYTHVNTIYTVWVFLQVALAKVESWGYFDTLHFISNLTDIPFHQDF